MWELAWILVQGKFSQVRSRKGACLKHAGAEKKREKKKGKGVVRVTAQRSKINAFRLG